MSIGTIKWFNSNKGYGFIVPEDGSKDIFVHITEVEKSGIRSLKEGQKVQYEIASRNGKTSATNLEIAE